MDYYKLKFLTEKKVKELFTIMNSKSCIMSDIKCIKKFMTINDKQHKEFYLNWKNIKDIKYDQGKK